MYAIYLSASRANPVFEFKGGARHDVSAAEDFANLRIAALFLLVAFRFKAASFFRFKWANPKLLYCGYLYAPVPERTKYDGAGDAAYAELSSGLIACAAPGPGDLLGAPPPPPAAPAAAALSPAAALGAGLLVDPHAGASDEPHGDGAGEEDFV